LGLERTKTPNVRVGTQIADIALQELCKKIKALIRKSFSFAISKA
jgi:hypothetical protein